MHSLFFKGARVGGGGGGGVVMWNTTAIMFYNFFFFFETFPNALTISWNILILTFIDYVDLGLGYMSKNSYLFWLIFGWYTVYISVYCIRIKQINKVNITM